MSISYINKTYGTNFKKGQKVRYPAWGEMCDGIITSATHHIVIKPCHAQGLRLRFHPLDIKEIQ